MEGAGSRLGRASSRYGPTPVFSGPVRKWKKQWTPSYQNNSSHSNNGNANSNNNKASALLLCRWTPISSTHSAESDNAEEPPRRKFRYTPIVALEEKKKEGSKKIDDEAKRSMADQSTASATSKGDDISENRSVDDVFMEETQAEKNDGLAPQLLNKSHLDLDLCLKGRDDNDDSHGENMEAKLGRVGSDGFWKLG